MKVRTFENRNKEMLDEEVNDFLSRLKIKPSVENIKYSSSTYSWKGDGERGVSTKYTVMIVYEE